MIKEITKTESGYDVFLDNGKRHHLDVVYMYKVIGYNDNDIIGTDAEGNLVRINTQTMDKEYYRQYQYEGKRHEIQLCGEKCWHVCQYKESEPVYDAVFEYLESCPEFDYIPDLVTYLIQKCIETHPADELAEELYRVLCQEDYPHAYLGEEAYLHLNERFEKVLELAKIVTDQI